jgi:UPF0716 protein FxsA
MRFLALFGVIALAEMATFLWVGSRIGLGWALGLALLTALLGSFLVKLAGLSVFARFRGRLRDGEVPGRELSDAGAILVAGAFLISPGFITDTLGFVLLIPAVRAWIHQSLSRRLSARFGGFGGGSHRAGPPGLGDVIDVEPVDRDQP